MALIVEDGTGVTDAAAYATVAEADTYWGERTHQEIYTAWNLAATTTAFKEGALREASDFLDGKYAQFYVGERAGDVQGLQWPRTNAVGAYGYLLNGLPAELVKATHELAGRAVSAVLAADQDRGGMVKSAKAGSVAVEFMEGATAETAYGVVQGILGPILNGSQSGAPTWNWA